MKKKIIRLEDNILKEKLNKNNVEQELDEV